MICRWCNHETILTEDATGLSSLLSGGATPQAQAQAQLMQQAKEAARQCRECGAQAHPLAMVRRLNGSGWLMFDNPDGSMFIEVMSPLPAAEGQPPTLRVVRWTLAPFGVEAAASIEHEFPGAYANAGQGIWRATLHDAPGGKREAGRPWEPVAEATP